jgi:hypothetical protein
MKSIYIYMEAGTTLYAGCRRWVQGARCDNDTIVIGGRTQQIGISGISGLRKIQILVEQVEMFNGVQYQAGINERTIM